MAYPKIYTSESVSEGHPDKLADQISDALLDECLRQDPMARAAIETFLAHGVAIVAGEVSLEGYVDVAGIVRRAIKDVGYVDAKLGFDGDTCGVMVSIQEQSADIAMGVNTGGAGDQGMMFGMATNETPELMPLPISIAHALMAQAASVRKDKPSLGFRPDAKAQVSVVYEGNVPKRIDTIVVSQQHEPGLTQEEIHARIQKNIVAPVLARYGGFVDGPIIYHLNPTGNFVIGGPRGDTGLTGRKIIVDTYGGMCPHGGGAFSGKDPTKVDRSAAYMARHVAKCIVAAGLASKAQVALAYAIGVAQPVSINVETFGTETMDPQEIEKRVRAAFDLSPSGITKHLDLRRPIYFPTAKNGHFGNSSFPWESTAAAEQLK
ncbi:methionine adenosyltransferase [Armatimonas sp.]|uniref:methionine adenosyltransferase n=1 Tax=Armatimonas sp. TaxID=1872638 RepID=UPI00286AFED1|nr:methionine adenosyltransferase [Armatimonas sp.]